MFILHDHQCSSKNFHSYSEQFIYHCWPLFTHVCIHVKLHVCVRTCTHSMYPVRARVMHVWMCDIVNTKPPVMCVVQHITDITVWLTLGLNTACCEDMTQLIPRTNRRWNTPADPPTRGGLQNLYSRAGSLSEPTRFQVAFCSYLVSDIASIWKIYRFMSLSHPQRATLCWSALSPGARPPVKMTLCHSSIFQPRWTWGNSGQSSWWAAGELSRNTLAYAALISLKTRSLISPRKRWVLQNGCVSHPEPCPLFLLSLPRHHTPLMTRTWRLVR